MARRADFTSAVCDFAPIPVAAFIYVKLALVFAKRWQGQKAHVSVNEVKGVGRAKLTARIRRKRIRPREEYCRDQKAHGKHSFGDGAEMTPHHAA